MPIKMVMETQEQRVFMNITANQCPGCPENLATRLVMHFVFDVLKEQNPIVFGQGCGIGRDFLQRSGLGTHDSGIVGMLTAMEIRGIDRPIVVIDGDGQIDIGLEDLATSFQQGYKYVHVVCDNQAHAASGSHATGSTHPLARTGVRPSGKLCHPKHFALMLMFSGADYVATASTSHPQDLERKIKNAVTRMPAFIQILTPCNPSWGYDDNKGVHVSRLAVECGIWPLYEWKDGVFRRQNIPRKATVRDYTASQRRYAHLTDGDVQLLEEYARDLNSTLAKLERSFAA
ncbi:MAG: thiamine pyrophosphate-dependent enzyme [Dehalococcoidia bacterium]